MSEIIFVKVRNEMGHAYEWEPGYRGGSCAYTDLWRLVRYSGFKTCELGMVDLKSDNTYIFFPDNYAAERNFKDRERACTLIHWNLERPGPNNFFEVKSYMDFVWVSDINVQGTLSDDRVRYVPVGGHRFLGGESALPKKWDYCHMAYMDGDRAERAWRLVQHGITMAPISFVPDERDYILARSRAGLCLHPTPHLVIEPLRYTLFACWRLPIVAEKSVDYFPYRVWELDPADPVAPLKREAELKKMADHNYALLTGELSFRACVEKGVAGFTAWRG